MISGIALHSGSPVEPLALWVVVTVAAMGASVLLGLGLAAFVRRRSRPYLLLAAAFAALVARSAVVGLTELRLLSSNSHHVVEHSLDVVLVALVVAAVYYARTVRPEVPTS